MLANPGAARHICDFQPEADQPLAEEFGICDLFVIWDL